MRYLILLAVLVLLAATPSGSAKIGQELHIYSSGDVHLVAAEVVQKHALNLISVEVWGQKWIIPLDQYTNLESAYGARLKLEEILLGHKLEIKGRPVSGKSGWLDARLVRDLDVKTGTALPTPAASPAPAAASPVLTPPAAPSASPTAAAASLLRPKLSQYLVLGMKGGEVIILQEFLLKNGWGIPDDGPVTGFFGKVTERAVKKFQESSELPPEGVVGPKTRALINAILAK